VRISYGYGMTELSPLSHHHSTRLGKEAKPGAGGLLPAEYRLQDCWRGNTGVELGPDRDERGEVMCPMATQVMKGYLSQPQATAELIDPHMAGCRTGDIGYVDSDERAFYRRSPSRS